MQVKMEKPLTRKDVLKLIEEHGGPEGLDLSARNLVGIDLSSAPTKLLPLQGINLSAADLRKANLIGSELIEANLSEADLSRARLCGAQLIKVNLSRADLSKADLNVAYLSEANLIGADLIGADLSGAELSEADLSRANLNGADLRSAQIGWTIFGDVDLSVVKGLDTVIHYGPSTIGMDTLQRSKGDIPEGFLRDCGISPWEMEIVRLYDPALTSFEISEILTVNIFGERTDGPLYIGGIFISYSQTDYKFVDKLYGELKKSGAAVWLDQHALVAGSLEKQVARALRIHDIVIVVLSENSIASDWVEHELEMARKKEKEENRDVLCPISLDDSWKTKVDGDVLWRQLKKKYVLDFSAWETGKFGNQFKKLLDGIKTYYG